MKLILFFVTIVSLIVVPNVLAHGSGLPPFFKINGALSPANPLQTAGILTTSFTTPQDLGPENYLANQPIDFEIDTNLLEQAIPKEIVDKTKFSWDFGDGTKAQGVANTHTYQKTGSVILSIIADYSDPNIPTQLIESVGLNIVPTRDYQIPKAVILVNGQPASGKGILKLDLNNKLKFDGSKSQGQITKYTWDFGDSKTSNQETVNHQYKLPQYFAPVVLHIEDVNGFSNDTFVNIQNSGKNDPNDPEAQDRMHTFLLISSIIWATVILIISFFIYTKFKR